MTRSLFLLAVATLTVSAAMAQAPAEPLAGGPPKRPHVPMPPPKNLKILPMTLTGDQVVDIMHKWGGDLNVECNYCHVRTKDPATGRPDFSSEANPVKEKARTMLRMTMAINKEYLTQLTPAAEHNVTCGTCHRGNGKPAVFVPPPHEHHPDGPPPAGEHSAGPPPAAAN